MCVSCAAFKEIKHPVPQGPDTPGSRRTFSWWPCLWCPPYTGQNQWSLCDRPYPTSGFPAGITHTNHRHILQSADKGTNWGLYKIKMLMLVCVFCSPSGHGKQSSLSASNPTQKRSQRRRNGFYPPKIRALSTNEKTAAIIKKRNIQNSQIQMCSTSTYTEKETLKWNKIEGLEVWKDILNE